MNLLEVSEIITVPGIYDVLLYAVSEAVDLGKRYIGILLDDGNGLILVVNQINEDVQEILAIHPSDETLSFCNDFALYQLTKDNREYTFKICSFKDLSEAREYFRQRKIVHYELIGGNLEDFLDQALGR